MLVPFHHASKTVDARGARHHALPMSGQTETLRELVDRFDAGQPIRSS
jgi:hypothetical protein